MHTATGAVQVTECNDVIVAISSSYARLLGYSTPGELVGKPISRIIAPRDQKRMNEFGHWRAEARPAPTLYEFSVEKRDGSLLPVVAHVSTVREGAKLLITTAIEPAVSAALLTAESFSSVYDEHAGRIFALLLKFTSSHAEAEDLLHDTFLQAWQQRDRYDAARASMIGWLVMIARSRALDRLRRSGRQTSLSIEEGERIEDGETDAIMRADSNRAVAALAHLRPEERKVVELAFFDGLSQREIAERLSTPLGTIKTRSLAAMKKLRKHIS